MDERTRLFLCVVLTEGCFTVLFGLFGAFIGAATWSEGRPAGTGLGLRVGRAFARLTARPLSPASEGALVGGADGAVFGAVMGLLVGLVIGWHFPVEWQVVWPVLVTLAFLVTAAAVFGLSAGRVQALGMSAIAGLFLGGMLGGISGFLLAERDGLFFGMVGGAAAGVIFLSVRERIRRG